MGVHQKHKYATEFLHREEVEQSVFAETRSPLVEPNQLVSERSGDGITDSGVTTDMGNKQH